MSAERTEEERSTDCYCWGVTTARHAEISVAFAVPQEVAVVFLRGPPLFLCALCDKNPFTRSPKALTVRGRYSRYRDTEMEW